MGAEVTQAIRADDLRLVLVSQKLRRHTNGRTALFCAMTPTLLLQVGCADQRRQSKDYIAEAKRLGITPPYCGPMLRGDIANLYERTRYTHGLAEVRRTWRTGLRALRAEPRHVLNGGDAAA